MPKSLFTENFDWNAPEELVAQEPANPRDHSRMMVLHRDTGRIDHQLFYNITDYLKQGDVLVLNNTKVVPARLTLDDGRTLLLLRKTSDYWEAFGESGEYSVGNEFNKGDIKGRVIEKDQNMVMKVTLEREELLPTVGQIPIPPYIHSYHGTSDKYQTIYAKPEGSAAAPTAGLHFTKELLEKIRKMGVVIAEVTLHVSIYTFLPITEKDILQHKIYTEYIQVSPESAELLRNAKRTICVGTTSVRTIEQMWKWKKGIEECEGFADIYITPGHVFHFQGMITNFHYPKTTNLVLVTSFASKEQIENAYRTAVKNKYRLFSFGDAMLIL